MEADENRRKEKKTLSTFWGMFDLDGNLRSGGSIPASHEELDGRMLVAYEELTRRHRDWRFYVMQAQEARRQGKSLLRYLLEQDKIEFDRSIPAQQLASMTLEEKYQLAMGYVREAIDPSQDSLYPPQ